MVNRFLERTVEVRLDGNQAGRDNSLELEYYWLESDISGQDGKEAQKAYGVEIVEKRSGIKDENKKFENIYVNREKIKSLVELLAENTVTPLHLPYILNDLLGT